MLPLEAYVWQYVGNTHKKIQFSQGVGKGKTTDNLKDQAFPFW